MKIILGLNLGPELCDSDSEDDNSEDDEHDFEFKLKHAEKFLSEGNKVRAFVLFRGRAIVYKERGEVLLLQFAQRLSELGKVEMLPKLEGKKMILQLSPKGKGSK